MMFRLVPLMVFLHTCNGYFQWSSCGAQEKRGEINEPFNASHVRFAHGCENKSPVTLSCKDGHKIAVLSAFFGHGHGHKSTCDSSWLGQNCGTRGVVHKVRYLCQNKQMCIVRPKSEVLGSTSCTFGLDADFYVKYVCNKEHIPNEIILNSLHLSPSPLTLPGSFNVSASLSINRYLTGSTKLEVDIQKNVAGVWTTIPCISDFGSCTYDNFCGMLRGLMFNKCDKEMEAKGVPCDCPFPTGTFTLPTQTVKVTNEQISQIPVPNFLVNGEYYLKAEFKDVYDRTIGCFEVFVAVHVRDKKKRSIHIENWDDIFNWACKTLNKPITSPIPSSEKRLYNEAPWSPLKVHASHFDLIWSTQWMIKKNYQCKPIQSP